MTVEERVAVLRKTETAERNLNVATEFFSTVNNCDVDVAGGGIVAVKNGTRIAEFPDAAKVILLAQLQTDVNLQEVILHRLQEAVRLAKNAEVRLLEERHIEITQADLGR
jgi:hypothetical protein